MERTQAPGEVGSMDGNKMSKKDRLVDLVSKVKRGDRAVYQLVLICIASTGMVFYLGGTLGLGFIVACLSFMTLDLMITSVLSFIGRRAQRKLMVL